MLVCVHKWWKHIYFGVVQFDGSWLFFIILFSKHANNLSHLWWPLRGEMCVFFYSVYCALCVFSFCFCVRAFCLDDCMRLDHIECARLARLFWTMPTYSFFSVCTKNTTYTHTTYSIVYLCQIFMVVSRFRNKTQTHTDHNTALHHGWLISYNIVALYAPDLF